MIKFCYYKMANLSEIVFKKVCRTCLSCSEDMKSLYDGSSSSTPISFADMLMAFTPLKFFGYDGLPRHICYNCIADLKKSYTFQLKCVESDTTLRKDIEKDVLSRERSIFTDPILGDPHIRMQDDIKIKPLINEIELIQNPLTHNKSLNQITDNDSKGKSNDVKPTMNKRKIPSDFCQTNSKSLNQNQPVKKIIFSCNICPMTFTKSYHFEAHIRGHTGSKIFVCTVCDQTFKTNRALVRHHMTAHAPESEDNPIRKHARLQCPNISEMHQELDLIHPKSPMNQGNEVLPSKKIWFTCKICTESFTHRSHLTVHMLDHARVYQFGCSVCHCRFAKLRNLVRHNRKVHSPKEPENKTEFQENAIGELARLKCSNKVPATLQEKPLLITETQKDLPLVNQDINVEANIEMVSNSNRSCITNHVPENPINTPLAFLEKLKDLNQELDNSKVKDNIETHNSYNSKIEMNNTEIPSRSLNQCTNDVLPPKKIFSCTICSITFPLQSYLRVHIRTHIVRKLFECRICQFVRFKKYRALVNHHSLEHNPERPVINIKFEGNSPATLQTIPVGNAATQNDLHQESQNQDMHVVNIEMKDDVDSNSDRSCITKPGHPFNTPLAFSEKLKDLNQDHYTKIRPPMHQVEIIKNSVTHSKINDSSNGANNSHDSIIEIKKIDIPNQNNVTNDKLPFKEKFSCVMCPKSFAHRNNLSAHIRTHTGFNPLKCPICGYSFAKERNLIRHYKRVHGPKIIKPSLIAETQTESHLVNQDINMDNDVESNNDRGIMKQMYVPDKPLNTPLTLAEMQKDLNQELDLIEHEVECDVKIKIENEEIIPPMDQITISEIHSPSLNKLYYDSKIEDNTNAKYTYNLHDIKIEMNKSSEIPSESSTTYNSSLNQNNLTDDMQRTENTFSCKICNRVFKQRRYLNVHIMKTHPGEMPFECTVCDTSFHNREDLASHMLTHPEKKPHLCTVCGRAFTNERQCLFHMQYSHNISI